jgi:antitoxin CcdA
MAKVLFTPVANGLRIMCARLPIKDFQMTAVEVSDRKRPVNVTLSESLVAQAKVHTSNLSATIELLLSNYVLQQQQALLSHQRSADACVADWNTVHASVGSFADEHNLL